MEVVSTGHWPCAMQSSVFSSMYVRLSHVGTPSKAGIRETYKPDKPGKLAQCIPIYGTILGQCTRNCANAGPIFLVCRELFSQHRQRLLCARTMLKTEPCSRFQKLLRGYSQVSILYRIRILALENLKKKNRNFQDTDLIQTFNILFVFAMEHSVACYFDGYVGLCKSPVTFYFSNFKHLQ